MERPGFNGTKFRELMLYAAQQSTDDKYFGATKLNKILFFSDFLSYALSGSSITGATYQRLKAGPAPVELKRMAEQLQADKDGIFQRLSFFRFTQKRLRPLRPANLHVFSREEIDLINEVIGNLAVYTGQAVSKLSHDRSYAWRVSSEGEQIPYEAVFISGRQPTQRDIARGQELARKYGWLTPAQ